MRHKWPVLAAVLPFMFGWILIAVYPAGATPAVAGATGVFNASGAFGAPGSFGASGAFGVGDGPQTARGRTQAKQTAVTSTNWAGYADTGSSGDFTTVTSSAVQPPRDP